LEQNISPLSLADLLSAALTIFFGQLHILTNIDIQENPRFVNEFLCNEKYFK